MNKDVSAWALKKACDHLFGDNFPSGAEVHVDRLARLLDEVERSARGAERARIVVEMREGYPMNKHAQEWAGWVERGGK